MKLRAWWAGDNEQCHIPSTAISTPPATQVPLFGKHGRSGPVSYSSLYPWHRDSQVHKQYLLSKGTVNWDFKESSLKGSICLQTAPVGDSPRGLGAPCREELRVPRFLHLALRMQYPANNGGSIKVMDNSISGWGKLRTGRQEGPAQPAGHC